MMWDPMAPPLAVAATPGVLTLAGRYTHDQPLETDYGHEDLSLQKGIL